jgi:beta-exotoxin I transport system permease protein
MNANLFRKELKRNRRSHIIWTSIIALFTIMVMSFFPSMQEMGEGLEVMMKSIPDEMKSAMGMSEASWNSIVGYYSTYYNLHIMVLSGIFAMSIASSSLAKEEKEHTSEFLYTRPLTRTNIYFSKGSSILSMVLLTIIIQVLFGLIGVLSFSSAAPNWNDFIVMHVNGAALVLFFACLGFFLPTLLKGKTNFMGISVGVVFGGYLINALSKISSSTEWIGYFSPFNYVNFSAGQADFTYSWAGISGLLILGSILIIIGAKVFNRKDFRT